MLEYDLSTKKSTNMTVLQKIDPHILEIVESAAHVAVYRFEPRDSKWSRYGVEGAAFITKSCQLPLNKLIILNKQGPEDFVLDLSALNKLKVQPPYLMIRYSTNGAPIILGLWFHDNVERYKIMKALASIIDSRDFPETRSHVNIDGKISGKQPKDISESATSTSIKTDQMMKTDQEIAVRVASAGKVVLSPTAPKFVPTKSEIVTVTTISTPIKMVSNKKEDFSHTAIISPVPSIPPAPYSTPPPMLISPSKLIKPATHPVLLSPSDIIGIRRNIQ